LGPKNSNRKIAFLGDVNYLAASQRAKIQERKVFVTISQMKNGIYVKFNNVEKCCSKASEKLGIC